MDFTTQDIVWVHLLQQVVWWLGIR